MKEHKESAIAQILAAPFTHFFRLDASAGILLFLATVFALAWANSPWSSTYFAIWQLPVQVGFAGSVLSKPLLLWINDGLMAVFFFLVGLEIKREILAGELSKPRQAVLPVLAAVGGMVVPAALYASFNSTGPGSAGWGIPMATDIAFALGILTLLGRRVPVGLKVFLTALAIVDDLGAVLVIAIFYSSKISLLNLALGAAVLAVMFGMARLGVRNPVAYAVFGIGGVWLAFLLSGVHATIAGVLAACSIPATVRIRRARFADELREAVDRLRAEGGNGAGMLSHDEQETVAAIEHACEGVQPPLQRLEHRLYPIVMYFIMPVFALANAGVAFSPSSLQGAGFSVALGIVVGLVAGKFLGVAGFSFLAIRLRLADLPSATTWRHLLGAGLLAGVGFTMSLFVSGLAFQSGPLGDAAKLGILAGSLVSGVAGAIVLLRSPPAE